MQFESVSSRAHCISLGWVEMPVSEQEKTIEAIEDEDEEDEDEDN
ncbi:MAG TPA: hypothetical protein VGW09_05440 [Nitrososphaeraceae archaeon]|nr:hypothetical protein [Nitrososphaeraceae archaeon]